MAKIFNMTGSSIFVLLGDGKWQLVSQNGKFGEIITHVNSLNTIRDVNNEIHYLETPVANILPREEYSIHLEGTTYSLWKDGHRLSNYK